MKMYWLSIEDLEKLSLSELVSLLEEERKNIHNLDGCPAFVHPGMLMEAKKVNLGYLHRLIRRRRDSGGAGSHRSMEMAELLSR